MRRDFNIFCSVSLISLALILTPIVGAESSTIENLKSRAEVFLETIRQEEWDTLVSYTVVGAGAMDRIMRTRLKISSDENSDIAKAKVGKWFRQLYGVVKPGAIRAVNIDQNDPSIALIEYRHGDLDAFKMRQIEGEWYYTLD